MKFKKEIKGPFLQLVMYTEEYFGGTSKVALLYPFLTQNLDPLMAMKRIFLFPSSSVFVTFLKMTTTALIYITRAFQNGCLYVIGDENINDLIKSASLKEYSWQHHFNLLYVFLCL